MQGSESDLHQVEHHPYQFSKAPTLCSLASLEEQQPPNHNFYCFYLKLANWRVESLSFNAHAGGLCVHLWQLSFLSRMTWLACCPALLSLCCDT